MPLVLPLTQADTLDPGLCVLLLGLCYEFNREPGEISRLDSPTTDRTHCADVPMAPHSISELEYGAGQASIEGRIAVVHTQEARTRLCIIYSSPV